MGRPTLPLVPALALALLLCSSTEAVGQILEHITFQESFSGKFSGKARKSKPASFSVLLPVILHLTQLCRGVTIHVWNP